MSNVDKRVVEMQFDNKQFEKDMATTVKSLKNFEKSLEFKDGSKGLDNVAKSFSNIESKANNLDFSKFESSINGISNRLSNMGIVAMTTIQNMATDVYNTIKGKFARLYDTVMGKGMSRALNLEQANFQLMGLLKNEEKVAQVMEDVEYGVKDTAYGLDEAAKVASQLAASNVTAGEYMKNSLRGISGVAAMTNSTYEEIGNIFTRVAGQGRVMATDLNSIAARGLNAAATLAEALGTTEANVRDLVSKGQIDFKTFATAMDKAFGDHAKEANKTFTGAMQNVQAALGRVGAGFKQPYIKFMRPVLVQLIQNINAVKDAFGPLYDTTSFVYEKLSNFAISVLKNFVDFRKEGNKEVSTINSLKESLQKMHDFIVGNWSKIANAINFVTIKILDFVKALKPIGDIISFVFRDLFGDLVGFFGKLNKDAQNNSFITKLREDLTIFYGRFIRAWPEIKSIFGSAFKILKAIFNFAINIIQPIKEAFIESFPLKEFIILLKNTSNLFNSLFSSITKNIKTLTNDGNALKIVFTFLFNVIRVFISILNRLIPVIQKVSEAIFNFSNKYLEKVKNAFIKLLSPVKKFKSELLGTNKSVNGSSKIFEAFNKILEVSGNIFGGLFDSLKKIFKDILPILKKVGSVFLEVTGKIFDSVINITKNIDLDSFFKGGIIAGLIAFISKIRKLFYKLDVGGLVGSLKGVLFQFKNLLIAYQREINAKALKELAIAIAILAGSLLVISAIPEKDLWRSVGAIAALFAELLGSFKLLSSTNGDFKIKDLLTIKVIASVMQDISVSVLVLAAALKVLSSLSWDELFVGLTGISVLLGEIIGVSRAIDKDAKKMQKTAKSMIYIAVAIRILASSAKIFSKFSWEELAKAGTAIAGLTGVFIGLSYAFDKKSKGLVKGSIAMVIFAESIKKLTKPLKELSKFSWKKLAKAGTAIAGLTLILSGFSRLVKSGSLLLASTGMLLLAASLKSIVPNLKVLGAMNWEELAKAGTAIAGLTLILSGFSRLVKSGSLLLTSTGMLLLAASLKSIVPNLKVLGAMNWEELAKAGTAIAGLITVFTLFSRLAKPGSLLLLSASLVILSSALSVFIIEMKVLSDMDLKGIIVSLAGIAGVFTIIGIAGKKLKTTVPTILKLSTALLLIGAGFGIAGLGLSAFIGAIASAGGTIKGIIDGIIDLFKAILDLIPHFFKKIGEGIAELIKVFVVMFTESFPDLLKAIGVMIDQLIPFILEYVPKLSDAAIKLIIAVIDTVASNVPKIFNALKNLFASFFKALSQTGKQFKIEDLFWAINAVALIAGLIYILQVIASDWKLALKGIALMGAVLFSLVAALVIINQFTNPEKSINLLKGIAEVVIALAGVFAIIASISALTQKLKVGSGKQAASLFIALGAFLALLILLPLTMQFIGFIFSGWAKDGYKELTVAIEVIKMVGQAFGNLFGEFIRTFSDVINQAQNAENITKILVPVLLSITPLLIGLAALFPFLIPLFAAIASGVSSIICFNIDTDKLKSSFETLKELAGLIGGAFGNLFGEFIRTFSDVINQAQNAENITKILVPVLLSITPLLIGLAALFPVLIPLFAAISSGAAAIMCFDIDTDKLKSSFETLKELAGLIGGLIGVFIGEIFSNMSFGLAAAMETFASGLSAFMEKLQPFLGYLEDISFDTLKKATMLTGIIIELAAGEVMAAVGTFVDKLAGGATLVSMAKIYSDFMDILFNGVKGGDGFFKLVGQLSQKQLANSLILAKIIKSMANAQIISAVSNWFRMFGGGNPLKDLAEQLSKAAPDMVLFSNILSRGKFNGDLTLKASECILMMARAANLMREGGLLQGIIGNPKNLADFAGGLSTLGGKLVEFSESINKLTTRDLENIKITIPIIESLIKIADSMPRENGVFQWVIGNLRDLGTFGDDLKNFGSGMLSFAVSLEGMTQEHADRFKLVEPIITSLVNIAKALPTQNGIWQLYFGETKDMSTFAVELGTFAEKFVTLAQKLNEISPQELSNLERLKPVIEGLGSFASAIQTTGIDISTLTGSFKFGQKQDIENFGNSLEALGNGLTKFAASTNKISVGNATNAQNAVTILTKLVPALNLLKTNETTILWYTSKQTFDFEDLGDSLGKLGTGLSTFAENTSKIGNIKNAGSISDVLKSYVDAIVATKDVDTNGVVNFVDSLNKINENSSKLTAATGIFGDNNYNVQKAYERVRAISNSITLLSNAFGNSNIPVPEGFFTSLYNLAYGPQNKENAREENDLLKVSHLLGNNNYNAQEAYKRIQMIADCMNELSGSLSINGDYSNFRSNFIPAINELASSNFGSLVNLFGENADLKTISTKTRTIAGILTDFLESFKSIDSAKISDVEDFADAVSNLADDLSEDLASKLTENIPKVTSAIESMFTSINDKIASKNTGTDNATKKMMENLNESIVSHTKIVTGGFSSVIKACLDELRSYVTVDTEGKLYTFYTAGSDAVAGYVKGIEDNIQKAIDAGILIGKKTLEGAKSKQALDEHSPSKAFGDVAYNGVLGLVNEFAACSSMAFDAGKNLGNSAMNGTKSIIANLDSAIHSDMNLQPVISPVLDLSEVSSQAGLIGGMLNAGTSYRIAGATSSLINQNNANRARARINQNRSPDVVEAVNALNSRMDSLEQAIINRPIVMDGEKVTKQIAPSMDRALGRRKYYSGRGN